MISTRYWNDMRDKFGFSDGEAVPEGADKYREAYIRTVNAIADEKASAVRAVAYDRPGVHNWCLILFAPKDAVADPLDGDIDACPEYTEPDDAMNEAIDEADTCIDVDSFLTVTVTFDEKGWQDAVVNM